MRGFGATLSSELQLSGFMVESAYPSSVVEIEQRRRARRTVLAIVTVGTTAAAFMAMVALQRAVPSAPAPALLLVGAVLAALVWVPLAVARRPWLGLVTLFAAAPLFGGLPGSTVATMPSTQVPFWWNISTIGQVYGHTTHLNALVFSPAEILLVFTLVGMVIHCTSRRDAPLRGGALLLPISAYLAIVALGFVHGVSNGGDVVMALYEVRAQVYFLLAYMLVLNLVRDKKQVALLAWILVICIGIESIMGTVNFVSHAGKTTAEGTPIHDDSLLFDLLFLAAFTLWMSRANRRMLWVSLLFVPTAIVATLDNQRRAGIAAFIVAIIPLLPLMWQTFKSQRKRVTGFGIAFGICSLVYLPIAWNAHGAWALPARAIKSQSSPDARDASSDAYRLAENTDLKFTRDTSPFIGIGYGRKFYQEIPLVTLSTNFLDYLPHDSVLWIWMRLGHLGFFIFWMMVAAILIRGAQAARSAQDPMLKLVCCLAVLNFMMIYVYARYDLQFTNLREMFLAGALVGILGVQPLLEKSGPADAEVVR